MATDPSRLSLTPEEIAELAPRQHVVVKSKRSKFIIFPVKWQYQLARVDADKCTYRVALYLLWEAWRSQSKRLKLPNVGLKELGVGIKGKYHALSQLAEAGLITIEQKPKKSPTVTVKFVD
jgi:hypothetical protein